jgi:hypothetical protein
MGEAQASGHTWRQHVRHRPTVEQDRDALARLIEFDADPFEVELYECASDPQALLIDRAQRSRAGQHARHVGRLRDRAKRTWIDDNADDNVPTTDDRPRTPTTADVGRLPATRAVVTSEKGTVRD